METENKRKELITSYCLSVRFDLDALEVSLGELREYDDKESWRRWFNLVIGAANNPSIYVCVDGRKNLSQFTKTFFGKDATSEKGQLLKELGKYPGLDATPLADVLRGVVTLREKYMPMVLNEKGEIKLAQLVANSGLKSTEQVVLVYAEVKATALGLPEFTPFAQIVEGEMQALPGYAEFIQARFKPVRTANGTARLCHATGQHQDDVSELDIANRYSLNSMFVKTTLHYAPLFAKNDFAQNYQVSDAAQVLLERGSKMLLDGYKVRIAGIDHLLLPKLLSTDHTPVESKLPRLNRKADMLFQFQKKLTATIDQLEEEDPDVYWITFLGFESDGNFFKTINLIEDVSQTYFSLLLAAFQELDTEWRQAPELPWEQVMWPLRFNLFTVYGLVPVRKDKEKRNAALLLFKQILERRPIARRTLFEHFRDLVLCHRYRRYAAYGNIYNYPNDKLTAAQAFNLAVRNSVYQYLALFSILTQFHLLADMDEPQITLPETEAAEPIKELSEYQQKVEDFLNRMNYSSSQRAMFFLGRALHKVAQAQADKEHKNMPIMAKLNYNGMDVKAIQRLCIDLHEKVRQYQLNKTPIKSPSKALSQFAIYFKEDGWDLGSEEALFYILSGYSFSAKHLPKK